MKNTWCVGNLFFKNYPSKKRNDKAYIFFSGFPGPAVPLPDGEVRLGDSLSKLFEANDFDFYYFYYSGVQPSKGKFSFYETIQDSYKVIEHVIGLEYDTISLIGQSWGAIPAINACKYFLGKKPIENLLFITPYCSIPTKTTVKPIIEEFCTKLPNLLDWKPPRAHISDLEIIRKSFSPMDVTANINEPNIFVAAGKQDEVVPEDLVNQFISKFPKKVTYKFFNEQHDFETHQNLLNWLSDVLFS